MVSDSFVESRQKFVEHEHFKRLTQSGKSSLVVRIFFISMKSLKKTRLMHDTMAFVARTDAGGHRVLTTNHLIKCMRHRGCKIALPTFLVRM